MPEKKKVNWDDVKKIEYGSEQHIGLLTAGYPQFGSIADAKEVLADKTSHYEERRQARAFLAAAIAVPVVVSPKKAWHKSTG